MMKKTLLILTAVSLSICAGILIPGGLEAKTEPAAESWIPNIHAARLRDWGALEFVERNLSGLDDGYGWVDVVHGIVHLDMDNSEWYTAALIHEASHVQQYKDGLQYYGSHAESIADAVARAFWDGWPQRHPSEIPDNGPVESNPIVEEK